MKNIRYNFLFTSLLTLLCRDSVIANESDGVPLKPGHVSMISDFPMGNGDGEGKLRPQSAAQVKDNSGQKDGADETWRKEADKAIQYMDDMYGDKSSRLPDPD